MNNFDTKQLTEAAIITAIGVVLALIGAFMPIMYLVLPIPYIVLAVRNNTKVAHIALAVSALIITLLVHPFNGAIFICVATAPALLIGISMNRKDEFSRTLFMGCIGSIIVIFMFYVVIPMLSGQSGLSIINQSIDIAGEMMMQYADELGKSAEEMQALIKQSKESYLMILPSMVILISALLSYIHIMISRLLLKRTGCEVEKLRTISLYRLPDSIVGGILIMGLLTYVVSYFKIVNTAALAANIIIIIQVIIAIQGLGVLSFLLEKRGIGNNLRKTILVFAMIIPYIMSIMFMIGLVDIMIDIRRLNKPAK